MDRHRSSLLSITLFTSLIFLMHMHQGYVLKLPNKFLQQHGGKIRDGLTVLKCLAALGRCAGLPLGLEGMPRNVVSMAIVWVKGVATGLTLVAPSSLSHAPRLGSLAKMLI
jgi:hypothetical protein